jgi:zinc protease
MALAAVSALPLEGAEAAVFNPETATLANGMQIVVINNPRVPVVTHMLWYRVGAIDEPEGRSGIAHLLEHLMFKGTTTRAPGEFSALVARHGGQENAFTSHDYTAYFQNVARDRLALMMELEADRMVNLQLTEALVTPERQVVLEERHERTDNNPGAILAEHNSAALFLNHPYRRPVIGWEHEIRGLTADDALTFYRRWYAPNNAILVVAGDVTLPEVVDLAEKTYGTIPGTASPVRAERAEPPQAASRRVTLMDERVQQPSWSRAYLAPGYRSDDGADHAYALQVLVQILGEGPTSRLYRRLVVETGQAVSAGAWYDPSRRGPARLDIAVTPRPGVTLEAVETAVDELLASVREAGVTDEDVSRAQRRMLADAVYARDSLSTGARVLGEALAIGLSTDDVEAWPERIRRVNRQQVNEAARAVLDDRRSVTSLLLPGEPEPRAQVR